MKKVLIFSGTTEGRILAEQLVRAGVACDVCVATDYGEQVMEEAVHLLQQKAANLRILKGRLDVPAMQHLYEENEYALIIDATHPYATNVSQNIAESVRGRGLKVMRVLREVTGGRCRCIIFKSKTACLSHLLTHLEKISGNIFLTTGSKELGDFCKHEELKKRLIVRVLPGHESLEICEKHGLSGSQIIAMQGPFSKEMNIATIRQYGIGALVTKESGKTGGEDEKISACEACGIPCYMIARPREQEEAAADAQVCSLEEALCKLEAELDCRITKQIKNESPKDLCKLEVTLAGIGMDGDRTLTKEVREAINQADYLFGAPRMIAPFTAKVTKMPFYLEQDILPFLKQIRVQGEMQTVRAVILFSGDTGFHSGCEKVAFALREAGIGKITILPGISSIQALSARVGISWQDACLLSLHGLKEQEWLEKLCKSVKHNRKTFFLLDNPGNISFFYKKCYNDNVPLYHKIILGAHISYENEQIFVLENTGDYERVMEKLKGTKALVTGLIMNDFPEVEYVVPAMTDEEFKRDKVPMTKEEIRQLSICRLRLHKNAVVYDIGAGTGSISVQIANLSPDIKVYALEKKSEAVTLVHENLRKHGLHNIEVIEAVAPDGLQKLPPCTHAFIGGSTGHLMEILEAVYAKNQTARVVVNVVSLETLCELEQIKSNFMLTDESLIQVSVSRAHEVGAHTMFQAQNPVYIYAFTFVKDVGEQLP